MRFVDTAVAVGSLVVALTLANLPHSDFTFGSFLEVRITLKNVLLLSSLTIIWPALFAAFGLYRLQEMATVRIELERIIKACTVGSAFAVMLALISASGAFSAAAVVIFWLTVTIGSAAARAAARQVLEAATRLAADTYYVIIAGTGPRAEQLYKEIEAHTSNRVVGCVDTAPALPGSSTPPFLGTINELESILVTRAVDAVYIALPVKSCYAAIEQVMQSCERVGVQWRYHADIFPPSVAKRYGTGADLIVAGKVVADDYRLWAKRAIDVAGAVAGLVVFAPLMLVAAIAIKCTTPGPILFAQERFGFNRRRLKMYKFRTMVTDAAERQAEVEHLNEAEGPIFKIRRDPRVTPVGGFLRRTSIDELPQLWNVLKGEMSLVGPRPMSLRDVAGFPEASLMRRFSVKPGLTCLWQINGRSNTGFDRWMELDLAYIDQWSLALDLEILARTVPAVLKGAGAV